MSVIITTCVLGSLKWCVDHAQKVHDVPDEYLRELLPMAKKIAVATGVEYYNILQNNGKVAHQVSPS